MLVCDGNIVAVGSLEEVRRTLQTVPERQQQQRMEVVEYNLWGSFLMPVRHMLPIARR